MELWDEVQGMHIDNDIPDHISWRLANDDAYSAKQAYDMFFIGRTVMPRAREL
jgi:hypothetical protein